MGSNRSPGRSEEQVRAWLAEVEHGRPVVEVERQNGLPEGTLLYWRKKLGLPAVAVANRWDRTRRATRELIEEAVALLKAEGAAVTLKAIREATTRISAGKRTIGESIFQSRPDLRQLVAELGGPPLKVSGEGDLRLPTIERDGWSTLCPTQDLERSRPPAIAFIQAFLASEAVLPSAEQVCLGLSFSPVEKVLFRFRILCREFFLEKLPECEALTPAQMLKVMQHLPNYSSGAVTRARAMWFCRFLMDHTDRPLTHTHLNELSHSDAGRDPQSTIWSDCVKEYRRSELVKAFDELGSISADQIVHAAAPATGLIERIDRMLAARVSAPDDLFPKEAVYSVLNYILDVQGRVPSYQDLRRTLKFVPSSNIAGRGYTALLQEWRKQRQLPQSARGGTDPTVSLTWPQLVATLPEPVRSAPNTVLDPRASLGRFSQPHDEVAISISKTKDPVIRAMLTLAALSGSGNEKNFPGFGQALTEVIQAAKLTGATDRGMEDAMKLLFMGELKVQYAADDEEADGDASEGADDEAENTKQIGKGADDWSSNRLRYFVMLYRAVAFAHQKYLSELDPSLRDAFAPFILPPLKDEVFWKRSNIHRTVQEAQRKWRKARTDALFPHFGEIRTVCEFKTNIASRIRVTFDRLVVKAKSGEVSIPHAFSITEPASPLGPEVEHSFVLWTRSKLGKAHKSATRTLGKSDRHLLEYTGARAPTGKGLVAELWFADLVRFNACHKDSIRTPETVAFMQSYGIGRNQYTRVWPVLCGGRAMSSSIHDLIHDVRQRDPRFSPVYFHPDGLYTLCLAGRAAMRAITVTTCRVNELQQIFAGPECLVKIEVPQLNQPAFAFMAIPKLRHDLEPFFIDERCLKFFREQVEWIASKAANGEIPVVPGGRNLARHKRVEPRPYLFQLPGSPTAMGAGMVGSILRFMLHGTTFRVLGGTPFQPGPHDLRHVTASAYRSEGTPIPVLAKMMKQKDYEVTDYYSEPTNTEVVAAMRGLQVATIGVGTPDGVRTPDDLQRQIDEADGKVGALSNVFGGLCGVATPCEARFACIGCGGLIPDHREEANVRRLRQRLLDDREFYAASRNLAEVRKAEQEIMDCDRVLEEMRLQKEAEADGKRPPLVKDHVVKWHPPGKSKGKDRGNG